MQIPNQIIILGWLCSSQLSSEHCQSLFESVVLIIQTKYFLFLCRFCTAGEDKNLRYFVSDGRNSSSVTILEGHLSYVNDCIIEPMSGVEVASVSGNYVNTVCNLQHADLT